MLWLGEQEPQRGRWGIVGVGKGNSAISSFREEASISLSNAGYLMPSLDFLGALQMNTNCITYVDTNNCNYTILRIRM